MKPDPTDLLTVGPEAIALGAKIAAALRVDSPGGKRITRAERQEILGDALDLIKALL